MSPLFMMKSWYKQQKISNAILTLFMWLFMPVFMGVSNNAYAQNYDINNIRIWHAPDHSRIVFDVSEKANYSISLLDNPSRYVVDFKGAALKASIPVSQSNQRMEQLRAGAIDASRFRVVIPIKKSLSIKSFQLTPNQVYGHRLVLDLFDADEANQTQSKTPEVSAPQNSSNAQTSTSQQVNQDYSQPLRAKKNIIIAIDAGHGGEDPGALGSKSKEKNVTLSIARRLAKIIDNTQGMKSVMIRTNDYFVRLRSRTNKARKANADLFVSIHADAALNKSARGMSVFALSQRGASSELARALARKENQADLVGGVSIRDKDDELAQVLLDLSLTNKISESVELGSFVLKRLSKLGKLHSKRVEQAGFAVLKSPDIPSVLVETGFITNRSEEKRLLSSRFQQKLAQEIYGGLVDYINSNPIQVANASFQITPSNHIITNQVDDDFNSSPTTTYHKVRSGDSLSKIASRYNISLKQLKGWNKLKNNVAVKGKRLRVSSIIKRSQTQSSANTTRSTSTATEIVRYTVKRGDTLSAIAERFGENMKSIRQRNKLKSSNVYVGQRLKVQTKKVTQKKVIKQRKPSSPKYHTVKSGEYLSGISSKYNVSIKGLKQLNKLTSNNIYVGQKLIVAGSTSSKSNSRVKSSAIKTIRHKVRRGQTLSGLAQKYDVRQSEIVAWNKLKKRSLFIGQTLLIKTKK